MSNRLGLLILVVVVATVAAVSTCTMIVPEFESVVLTEFGEPVGEPITTPGLRLVMPWYERHIFPKRLLRWDGNVSQIPTRDKRFILVDATARWRILDPLQFLRSVTNVNGAQTRLDDIIDSAVRTVISDNELIELVRTERELIGLPEGATATALAVLGDGARATIEKGRIALQTEIVTRSNATTKEQYGIEVVDVRVKRINYIDEVQSNIFNRMIAERKKVAEQYRSEGKGKAAEILGRMERDLKQIESEAFRKAREIEGAADADAARIYAEAYGADPEFYAFLATLDTWERGLGKGERTRMILGTDSDLLRYLQRASPPPEAKITTKP
ncbi:MAG: protease modulator HflC [Deltaproteobacteria bacterium]|nr:protease modulator HflC [Deltaproteobacteria bacterium]